MGGGHCRRRWQSWLASYLFFGLDQARWLFNLVQLLANVGMAVLSVHESEANNIQRFIAGKVVVANLLMYFYQRLFIS